MLYYIYYKVCILPKFSAITAGLTLLFADNLRYFLILRMETLVVSRIKVRQIAVGIMGANVQDSDSSATSFNAVSRSSLALVVNW